LDEDQSFWIIGLMLVAATVLTALHQIKRSGGVKLKFSSRQGYLAYFLMGIQFLWALPFATVIIWASIYSATH
jgi:hypothetical protein